MLVPFHMSTNLSCCLKDWCCISCQSFLHSYPSIVQSPDLPRARTLHCSHDYVWFFTWSGSTWGYPADQWPLTSSMQPLTHHWESLHCLFCRCYFGPCSLGLPSLVPIPLTFVCLSCTQTSSHPYQVFVRRFCTSRFLLSLECSVSMFSTHLQCIPLQKHNRRD